MLRSTFAGMLFACVLHAEALPARPNADSYMAQAELPKARFAADFLARTVPREGAPFFAEDHLVIEVAVYPAKGEPLALEPGQFSLRINKAKHAQLPQTPGMVAASITYPDWEQRGSLEAVAGIGDGAVVIGRPERQSRFPGDPTVRQPRTSPTDQTPDEVKRARENAPPKETALETLSRLALQPERASQPGAGLLYFSSKEKIAKIKSLELIYSGPAGDAVLKLR